MAKTKTDTLMAKALEIARSYDGVREDPPNSNWGKEVAMFLASTGLTNPDPWCAAFVYYCIEKAAKALKLNNPFAGLSEKAFTVCWLEWARENGKAISRDTIRQSLTAGKNRGEGVLTPGMIFLIYYPKLGRVGHIGFVAGPPDENGVLATVEGNTDPKGSRAGDGVYVRTRKLKEIYCAFSY